MFSKENQVIAGLIASFLMCILRHTDAQPHGRFVWQDQREAWKSKGCVFWSWALDSNLFKKEKKDELKASIFLSNGRVARRHPLSLLSPLQLTQPNLGIAPCVFTKASYPIPSLISGHSISTASFWKQPSASGRREKTPLGSEIALSHKKESLLR